MKWISVTRFEAVDQPFTKRFWMSETVEYSDGPEFLYFYTIVFFEYRDDFGKF